MIKLLTNPEDYRERYLASLNACFPGWGGDAMYEWAFEREVGAPHTDLLVLRDESELFAGSAVSYRRVSDAKGERIIAIMTGSWTLPAARRRGCFSRLIEASVSAGRAVGATELLAFVTHDNASCRRLRDAGSAMLPTHYHWYDKDKCPDPTRREGPDGEATLEDLHASLRAEVSDETHFVYPDEAAWRGQILDRSRPTRCLHSSDWHVVLEERETADAVLVSTGDADKALGFLIGRAAELKRGLSYFTTDAERSRIAVSLGLQHKDGFLTVLPFEPTDEPPDTAWVIQSGDRM